MQLDFSDEQDELRAGVRTVLERECAIGAVRELAEKSTTLDSLWSQMVDLGWPALTVPEAAGGLGLGFVEVAVVAEELGRALAPGPWLPTVTQYVATVKETGKPEQRNELLAEVAAGERTGTLAVAEESGSWDVADVTTTVESHDNGWRINGTKRFVIEGDRVDDLVVVGRLPDTRGEDGVTALLVPVSATRTERLDSLDATRSIATIHLDDVRVPHEAGLGEPGGDAIPVRRALDEAVTALSLEMIGTAQTIFDTILEYAKERHQFGVPIGSFQAIKHKFADMYVALERARGIAYFAAATLAEDDERRSLASSMAKAAAGDCQRLVAKEGIQVLGGIGYTWEHDMHLYVRRVKSGDALLGTAADHRARVADLLGV